MIDWRSFLPECWGAPVSDSYKYAREWPVWEVWRDNRIVSLGVDAFNRVSFSIIPSLPFCHSAQRRILLYDWSGGPLR
jgi:hypothetical protein